MVDFSCTDKMFKKYVWVLGFTTSMALVFGEYTSGSVKDSSFLRLLNNHLSSFSAPRIQWTNRPQEDSHRHSFEGISHGSTYREAENSYEGEKESGSSEEYRWSNPGWQNLTNINYYGYSRPSYGYPAGTSGATEFLYKNSGEKFYSRYPYQQVQPVTGNYVAIKKTPSNNPKEKFHALSFDVLGKSKFKKNTLYQSPSDNKKVVFSRLVKPYSKNKYPSQSHPLYRRYYYQSPYQRYAIPPSEWFRYKETSPIGGYHKASSASANQDPGRRYTTERMDDAYPDGSAAWEDYSSYNDSNHNTSGNYYEETYEEGEKPTVNSEERPQEEEGTTRGYYGDRIYMSTQTPLVTFDKTGVKNKYFIIRRTPHDDDIETLFE